MSAVRISPDERSLAVVSGVGWLVLWELRLSGEGVCKVWETEGGRERSSGCPSEGACVGSTEGRRSEGCCVGRREREGLLWRQSRPCGSDQPS